MAKYSAMVIESRTRYFEEVFPKSPSYRLRQFEAAFFTPGFRSIEILRLFLRLSVKRLRVVLGFV